MKTLYLLRHGHAEPDRKEDSLRKLSKQGIVQVQKIAALYKHAGFETIDFALSSGATRTKETCELFLKSASIHGIPIEYKNELYLANETRIIHELESISGKYNQLLYVGHNPGIEQAAASLAQQYIPMGTATLIIIKFEIEEWALLGDSLALSVDILEP